MPPWKSRNFDSILKGNSTAVPGGGKSHLVMEDSPAVQLIAVEIEHPEFAALINDIREFDWRIVNRLRKEDLARVHSTGFEFKNKGLENQRMELKSFLLDHPSCMASDFEMIISKLNIFGRLIAMKKMAVVEKEAKKDRKQTKKQKRIKHEKPKVIVIEEEEEEEEKKEEEEERKEDEETNTEDFDE